MYAEPKTVLKNYFGYDSFKKGQREVINSILQGQDTFTIMPTGGGKSLCYQLSSLLLDGITLVISPLISLMKDQVDALTSDGIKAAYINSSLSVTGIQQRLDGVRRGRYQLLYVAPERLESRYFLQLLKKLEIALIAVDEAHCVSQWGHDFRPDYLNITKIFDREVEAEKPLIAAFTATATPEVRDDVIKILSLQEPFIFTGDIKRKNLTLKVRKVLSKDRFLIKYIVNNKNKCGIIFASTRKEVERINNLLKQKGYQTDRYHAGLTNSERKRVQELFIQNKIKIIVATNAFGMGIDKHNVRYIIHNNIPGDLESYYQQAGRAGRDGKPGECILLYSNFDYQKKKFLIKNGNSKETRKKYKLNKLKSIFDYCHTGKCLQQYIIKYFSEEKYIKNFNNTNQCFNCSNCLGKQGFSNKIIYIFSFFINIFLKLKNR